MKRTYCTDTQEHIPPEYFTQGKAVWCNGKPYLASAAMRLRLKPDAAPPADAPQAAQANPARTGAKPPPLPSARQPEKNIKPPPLPPALPQKQAAQPPPLPAPLQKPSVQPPPLPAQRAVSENKPPPLPIAKEPVNEIKPPPLPVKPAAQPAVKPPPLPTPAAPRPAVERAPAVAVAAAAQPAKAQPAAGKRRWLRRVAIASGVLGMLLLLTIGGALLYFNDDYFKELLRAEAQRRLGRELLLDSVRISFWHGRGELKKLRLKSAGDKQDALRIDAVNFQLAHWPLIKSGLKNVELLKIEVQKPELVVEHHRDGDQLVTSLDDIIQRLMSGPPSVWPRDTGLQQLNGELSIQNGVVLWVDDGLVGGETRLDELNLTAALQGLGSPTVVKAGFALSTPESVDGGTAEIIASANWIDASGKIDPRAIKDISTELTLRNIDVAQFVRHLGAEVVLPGTHTRLTPGKPLSGTLTFNAPAVNGGKFKIDLNTRAPAAIHNERRRMYDELPTTLNAEFDVDWSQQRLELGELGVRLEILSAPSKDPGRTALKVAVESAPPAENRRQFKITFDSRVDELLATHVAEAMGLKGQAGGALNGTLQIQHDGAALLGESALRIKDGFVQAAGVRQPLNLDLAFKGKMGLKAGQLAPDATLEFSAKSQSCELISRNPVRLSSLNDINALSADAIIDCRIQGREFWQEFAPLLALASLTVPLEETFEGQLRGRGSLRRISAELDGKLLRQVEQPNPISLLIKSDYDANAFGAADKPWLALDVAAKSTADAGTDIHMAVEVKRGEAEQVVEVADFKNVGSLSALNNLNARFAAYAHVFLGPKYVVNGGINQTGRSRLVQKLAPDGSVAATSLTLTTEIKLSQADLKGPALVEKGPPLQWSEKELALQLSMSLDNNPANAILAIEHVKLDAETVSLEGSLASASVAKLKKAGTPNVFPAATWIEALPKAALKARASGEALTRLQKLGILPNDERLPGDLEFSAEYDAARLLLQIPSLAFKGKLMDAQLKATDANVATLAALIDTRESKASKWVAAIPGLTFDVQAHAPLLSLLQSIGACPVQRSSKGELVLKGSYDAKARRARIQNLDLVTPPDLSIRTSFSEIDVPALTALAEMPGTTLLKWVEALPEFTFESHAGTAALQRIQDKGYWFKEPLTVGDLKLKGRYAARNRRATIEALDFSGPNLRFKVSTNDVDVPALASLSQEPGLLFQRWLPAFPDLAFDAFAQGPAVARLQKLQILPPDSALQGDIGASGNYSHAAQKWTLKNLSFGNSAAEFTLSAPGIDMQKLAQFVDAAERNPASVLRLFGDFALKLKGKPEFFNALRERKFFPDDIPVSGEVELNASYDLAQDRLNFERISFVRESQCSLPLKNAVLSGQVSGVTKLAAGAPDFFGLLNAFDKGIQLSAAEIEPPLAFALLKRKGVSAAWLDDCIAGVYRIQSPVIVKDLIAKPISSGVFDVSMSAQVNAGWRPRSAPDKPPASADAATASGNFRIAPDAPLRLDVSKRLLRGAVLLNDVAIKYPNPVLAYDKAAGVACKLALDLEQRQDNTLHAAVLDVAGGPVNFSTRNLTWHAGAPSLKLALEKFSLNNGPTISNAVVDMSADKLRGSFSYPSMDLRAVRLDLPAGLSVSGVLTNIQGVYDGSISKLKSAAPGPGDKYSVRFQLNNFQAAAEAGRGKTMLAASGELTVENARLMSPGLAVSTLFTPAGGQPHRDQFAASLDIFPRRQDVTLIDAAREAGLPLVVKTGVRMDNALDVDKFVESLRVFADAASGKTADANATIEVSAFERIKALRVEASLSAPQLKYDDFMLQNVLAALLVLDELKIGIKDSRASVFGGDIQIVEAVYDLTTQPMAHRQQVSFSNISLPVVMGVDQEPPVKDKYQVFARLSGSGALEGAGFRRWDRRSWSGSAAVTVSELVLLKNGGKEQGRDIGKALVGGLGAAFGGGLGRAAVFYSNDFGLFLNLLEFEDTVVQAQLNQGNATVFRSMMTGKGRSAGLQFGFGGNVDIMTQKFDPKFFVWPTWLPESSQRAMGLFELDAGERQQILNAMAGGAYYLTLTGKLSDFKKDDKPLMDLLGYIDARIQAKRTPVPPQPNQFNQNPQQQVDWQSLFNAFNNPNPTRQANPNPPANNRSQNPNANRPPAQNRARSQDNLPTRGR